LDKTAHWLQWIENTVLATYIRQSLWLYPGLEIVHILGIAILVGAAFMFDLRLLGFSKKLPIEALGNHLLSWSKRGLWLIIPSGLLMFITNAETLGFSWVFWAKMALIVMGGFNALFFHRFFRNSRHSWDQNVSSPPLAQTNACLSIIIWISVIACGRLLAY